MKMTPKVEETLNGLLKNFESGNIVSPIAKSMFPAIEGTPSAKWSLLNRTLMFVADTADGRGFKQWQNVKRKVKKGSKAFYILTPLLVKDNEDPEQKKLIGFKATPIFRYEDTEGEPLAEMNEVVLPDMPLMEVAEEWGISVKAIPGNYKYYGYYQHNRGNGKKKIRLATKVESTFFHELAHAAHDRIQILKPGQDPFQEIIAELSAQALCQIVGKSGEKYIGNSYQYIKRYAEKVKLSPFQACTRVISTVDQVLGLILTDRQDVVCEAA